MLKEIMMGFFSKLDLQIVDLLSEGFSAEDIITTLHVEYNGIVSKSTISETIEAYSGSGIYLQE